MWFSEGAHSGEHILQIAIRLWGERVWIFQPAGECNSLNRAKQNRCPLWHHDSAWLIQGLCSYSKTQRAERLFSSSAIALHHCTSPPLYFCAHAVSSFPLWESKFLPCLFLLSLSLCFSHIRLPHDSPCFSSLFLTLSPDLAPSILYFLGTLHKSNVYVSQD